MSTTTSFIEYVKENPGCIASEAGATNADMIKLEKEGHIKRVGLRSTGKRGRPPVQWAVADADVEVFVQENQTMSNENAVRRVDDFTRYERDYAKLSAIRTTFGLNSEEAREARLEHKEKWPQPPVLPSKNDFAACGNLMAVEA